MTTKTLRGVGAAIIVAALSLLGVGALASTATATQPNPSHKVTICHATDSYTNPYVRETVDIASSGYLKAGHNGHTGPVFYVAIPKHTKWGDIIPPYTYQPAGTKKNPNPPLFSYPGLNWNADGRAIYDLNCGIPVGPKPTESETPTPTPTDTQHCTDETCESETPTPTPTETTPEPTCTPADQGAPGPRTNMVEPTACATSETPTPTPTETTETPTPTPTETTETSTPTPSFSELGGCPLPLTNGKCVLPKTGSASTVYLGGGALLLLLGASLMLFSRPAGSHQ